MSRSSSGGLGPARGTGLESRLLAWLAAHMLAGQPLSDRWAPGGATITAIGGQTARPIDDVGAVTSADGHLLIQAKTRLTLGTTKESPLAKAIRQVVHQYREGIPADPEDGTKLRAVDPNRDRLLIVTDHSAPAAVQEGLNVAADQLSELAHSLPFTDVGNSQKVTRGRDVLLGHLRREWEQLYGAPPLDADLRGILRVLRFAVVDLRDDGRDRVTAQHLLERAAPDGEQYAPTSWGDLTARCHELAEHNFWLRAVRLRQKIASDLARRPHRNRTRDTALFRSGHDETATGESRVGVGQGIPSWTRRFQAAFNAVNGPVRLGEPVGFVEDYGPGVAQYFSGARLEQDWVLTAVPEHQPVAVAGSIWSALEEAPGGVVELGLPTLDRSVPASSRILGKEVQEVRLTRGTRGAGRLVRLTPEADWTWQPEITTSMNEVRLSRHWTPDRDEFTLRVRVAVTLPWNRSERELPITAEGRARLASRLPDSRLRNVMSVLSARRGGSVAPGAWHSSTRERTQSLYKAVYRAEVATNHGPALAAEVKVTGPSSLQTHPVVFAELQLERGLWDEVQGMPRGEPQALNVSELVDIVEAAWQTAAEIAPLAFSSNPERLTLVGAPTVEFHIQPFAHSLSPTSGYTSASLTDEVDLSGFGTSTHGPVPEMCVALTAPLALTDEERLHSTRKALVHVAHAFGYIDASEDSF